MEIEDNISSLQMYLPDKKVAHQAKSFPKCFVLTPKVSALTIGVEVLISPRQ